GHLGPQRRRPDLFKHLFKVIVWRAIISTAINDTGDLRSAGISASLKETKTSSKTYPGQVPPPLLPVSRPSRYDGRATAPAWVSGTPTIARRDSREPDSL